VDCCGVRVRTSRAPLTISPPLSPLSLSPLSPLSLTSLCGTGRGALVCLRRRRRRARLPRLLHRCAPYLVPLCRPLHVSRPLPSLYVDPYLATARLLHRCSFGCIEVPARPVVDPGASPTPLPPLLHTQISWSTAQRRGIRPAGTSSRRRPPPGKRGKASPKLLPVPVPVPVPVRWRS